MRKHLKIAESLAHLLDNQFQVGKYRFGIDPLIGAIPVLGDIIGIVLGLYLVWIGAKAGMHKFHLARMIGNIFLDAILGVIPFIGDFFDFTFKANEKNMKILRKHFEKRVVEEGEVVY